MLYLCINSSEGYPVFDLLFQRVENAKGIIITTLISVTVTFPITVSATV